MKTNKMMRIASVLLVAVLLSTCAISGTFAKYVTSGTTDDSARVAKWGVTVTANSNMFGNAYGENDAIVSYVDSDSDETLTVRASASGTKVVAPGTKGSLADFTVSGTPEVDVTVSYSAVLTLTGWTLSDDTEYCPIVFTVGSATGSATYGMTGTTATNTSNSISELVTAVQNAIANVSASYHTNTNLSEAGNDLTVSWAWAYEGNNDTNDTFLGNKGENVEIDLDITMTITQDN